MSLCLFSGGRFKDTFENSQWRKTKQMQPMWLCLFLGMSFEDASENPQWKKINKWNQCNLNWFRYQNWCIHTSLLQELLVIAWQNSHHCRVWDPWVLLYPHEKGHGMAKLIPHGFCHEVWLLTCCMSYPMCYPIWPNDPKLHTGAWIISLNEIWKGRCPFMHFVQLVAIKLWI